MSTISNTNTKQKKRILFVCLGNICRSTMAEIIFRAMVFNKGKLDEYVIDSAGTSAYHIGDNADQRTLDAAKAQLGKTISAEALHHFEKVQPLHRARQFTENDLVDFDYVFAMDESNLSNIKKIVKHSRKENANAIVKRLGEYHTQKKINVEDPYYGDMSNFFICYNHVFDCCVNFLNEIDP